MMEVLHFYSSGNLIAVNNSRILKKFGEGHRLEVELQTKLKWLSSSSGIL
jgi:hypothetical protein